MCVRWRWQIDDRKERVMLGKDIPISYGKYSRKGRKILEIWGPKKGAETDVKIVSQFVSRTKAKGSFSEVYVLQRIFPRRILKTILPFRKVLKWNYEENILHISGFPNRISTFRDLKSKEAPFKALSLRIECRDWMERETPWLRPLCSLESQLPRGNRRMGEYWITKATEGKRAYAWLRALQLLKRARKCTRSNEPDVFYSLHKIEEQERTPCGGNEKSGLPNFPFSLLESRSFLSVTQKGDS